MNPKEAAEKWEENLKELFKEVEDNLLTQTKSVKIDGTEVQVETYHQHRGDKDATKHVEKLELDPREYTGEQE